CRPARAPAGWQDDPGAGYRRKPRCGVPRYGAARRPAGTGGARSLPRLTGRAFGGDRRGPAHAGPFQIVAGAD
ncbi:MAG: hypothetical protein AAF228_07795, partial [Pseudomonadota bacterium]